MLDRALTCTKENEVWIGRLVIGGNVLTREHGNIKNGVMLQHSNLSVRAYIIAYTAKNTMPLVALCCQLKVI